MVVRRLLNFEIMNLAELLESYDNLLLTERKQTDYNIIFIVVEQLK